MSPDGLVITAGVISFAGNWKKTGGYPSNGLTIIGATAALAILFSTARGTALEGPVKGLAGLMILAAVYTYVPNLSKGK